MRENEGKEMTTNTDIKISNDENSLTASDRFRTIRHSAGTPNGQWEVNDTFLTGSPLLYDGLLLIGGEMDDHFLNKASSFVVESYNHFKPIGSFQNGSSIIQSLNIEGKPGVLIEQDPTRLANEFIKAMTKQRFWDRAYS